MAIITDEALACTRLSEAVGREWNIIRRTDEATMGIRGEKLSEKLKNLVRYLGVPAGTRNDYTLSANPTVISSFQSSHANPFPIRNSIPPILTDQPHPLETFHCLAGD
ncbi:hypothetical protein N7G274_010620 [Stereocaulon virgatum]|uniref:Uncharacterized protein n=1 Tax=Stereocaulon virgatum TaxID=373712 RepID=A0ABR3ZUA9_9LECA